jgi:hypothetical protein
MLRDGAQAWQAEAYEIADLRSDGRNLSESLNHFSKQIILKYDIQMPSLLNGWLRRQRHAARQEMVLR